MDADEAADDDAEDGWYALDEDADSDLETSQWYRVAQVWEDLPDSYKPAGNTFLCLRCVFWALLDASSDGSPLVGLEEQLLQLFQGLSRFIRMYEVSIWGRYGLGHILAGAFKDLLPRVNGSKALRRRVNREARDLLYKIYGKCRASPDFIDTVPMADRPSVTTSTVPNPSGVPPGGEHQPSSSSTEAALNQITCSRPRREGEGSKSVEQDTGLQLAGPFGPHRVWLPRAWTDWSTFDTS